MRVFTLLVTLFLVSNLGLAQADPFPPGISCVLLETQADVDNFAINHPGETTFDCIELTGPEINNLDGLAQIQFLGGIIFRNSSGITDATGLAQIVNLELGLVAVDYLLQEDLETTMQLFQQITTIDIFVIQNCAQITDASAFSFIESIDRRIKIESNPNLTTLTGIENIQYGPSFSSYSITNNPNLSDCSIASVCNYFLNTSGSDFVLVEGNASGCMDETEIINNCGGCPASSIVLSSQADVDDFPVLYPNCSIIEETLLISGADITDLTPLNGITEVGYLGIIDNPLLTSLNGLESLVTLESPPSQGGVSITIQNNNLLTSLLPLSNVVNSEEIDIIIRDNPSLTSMDGLQGITGVVYTFEIANNDQLLDFTGLSGIVNTDDFFIQNNPSLVSFNGLDNLTITGSMTIINNDALTALDFPNPVNPLCGFGLVGNALLENIDGFVSEYTGECGLNIGITDNPSLFECDIPYVCDALTQGIVTISGNNTGCNSNAQVEIACSTPDCPDVDLTLASQAEVDAFAANYPNCTQLTNVFVISGGDITDLSGLSQITASTNLFDINANPNLTTLNGLSPIEFSDLGALTVRNNESLQSLSTFSGSLAQFNTFFTGILIENNPLLTSLAGLEGITEAFALFLRNNDLLPDLTGLEGLITVVDEVLIANNGNLQTIEQLNLEGSLELLTISGNSSLMNLEGLGSLETVACIMLIVSNSSLVSLDGLEGITNSNGESPFLGIENNNMLTDISGIGNFEITSLTIAGNGMLSECEISNICDFIGAFPDDPFVANNAVGCNTVPEIQLACEALSVEENEIDLFVDIYPNPVSEVLNISMTSEMKVENVRIYSIGGQELKSTSEATIHLANLSEGIYFLRIKTDSGSITKRFIKE